MEACTLDDRTLWIVSGGAEAVPGIRCAKKMGLRVVVSDGNPSAPGFAHADVCIIASTYDEDATLDAAQDFLRGGGQIDGVMCMAADVPKTVAYLARALDLPGHALETAMLSSDKLAMKRRFAERGVPIPWFQEVCSEADLKAAVAAQGDLVIKPVDSRGARGVLRLGPQVNLGQAFAHAQRFSPTGRVMVEEFLSGPQISTESVLLPGGQAATPGFIDRNYELIDRFAPYMIEDGGQQPSQLRSVDQEAVARLAETAGRAIGIEFGTVKGDMVLTPDGPKVIEVAARLSGGWMSTDQVPLATGVDLVGIAIRLALGDPVSLEDAIPRADQAVAIRYFWPSPGRVVSVSHVEQAIAYPWVHRLHLFVGCGDMLESATNHTQRAGFVITVGDSSEEAVARARQVVSQVGIETAA